MILTLAMIVKDEASSIEKTLTSCLGTVDSYVILDTGSTDGTQKIVDEFAHKNSVPMTLTSGKFIDFATTRNEALELAEDSSFTLMLSGGESLFKCEKLREFLEKHNEKSSRDDKESQSFNDGFLSLVRLGDNLYPSTRITRSSAKWRYKGATHEVIMGPNGEFATLKAPGLIVHEKDVNTEKQRKRWEIDAALLFAELQKNQNLD